MSDILSVARSQSSATLQLLPDCGLQVKIIVLTRASTQEPFKSRQFMFILQRPGLTTVIKHLSVTMKKLIHCILKTWIQIL